MLFVAKAKGAHLGVPPIGRCPGEWGCGVPTCECDGRSDSASLQGHCLYWASVTCNVILCCRHQFHRQTASWLPLVCLCRTLLTCCPTEVGHVCPKAGGGDHGKLVGPLISRILICICASLGDHSPCAGAALHMGPTRDASVTRVVSGSGWWNGMPTGILVGSRHHFREASTRGERETHFIRWSLCGS